jgi:hypothetical protein
MTFTKKDVFNMCVVVAPQYGFEVSLIQALCLKESGRNKDGTFEPSRARMEPGFYSRYIEKQNLETTNEILYSASYGVTQMMGQSLKEIGFFEDWFNGQTDAMKIFLGNAYSEITVPKAINWYCANLNPQIKWACKWLQRKKDLANGDTFDMLRRWNGNPTNPVTANYANDVLAKKKAIEGGKDFS